MIEEKLASLGLILPGVPKPAGSYIPSLRINDLVFISGQVPFMDGKLLTGKVGSEINVDSAKIIARICALNVLSVLKDATNGDLSKVKKCVKLGIFVSCADDFHSQPEVANGASDLIASIFGDVGMHTRAAVSVNSLPLGVAVEVDAIFELN